MPPNENPKNLENRGQELCIKRDFTAVISCNPHIKLQINDEMQKKLGLFRIEKSQKKTGVNDEDWEQYFAFTVDHKPEMVVIQDINNIHNEVQKNIPDEVLEKIDTYISALSLALDFGFVVEDLYVSGYQLLDKEGRPEIHGSVRRVRVRLQLPFDIKERHKKKFDYYSDLLSTLDENYRGNILRAIRWWGRGSKETDKIDKFINFYIAFELIGKKIAEEFAEKTAKSDKEKKEMKEQWINTFCNVCKLDPKQFEYNGFRVNQIRAALVHAKHKELTKEQAEELTKEYADEFGKKVLKAIKAAIAELSQIE